MRVALAAVPGCSFGTRYCCGAKDQRGENGSRSATNLVGGIAALTTAPETRNKALECVAHIFHYCSGEGGVDWGKLLSRHD